jgi:hypothetical protein
MSDPRSVASEQTAWSFRRNLALRILASVSIAQAACGDGASMRTSESTGTGGSTSAGGDAGTGGGSGAMVSCFTLQSDGGTCPTDLSVALAIFVSQGCLTTWEAYQVLSGPLPTVEAGQCCYMAEVMFCSGPTGRAYLVDHRPLVAAPLRTADAREWAEARACAPSLDGLTSEDRAALADAWSRDALQEHASVASFSRASLALLAAGAPADLVEDTHRAALDEITHARLCFALASAYAGSAIAPGPFPLGGEVQVGTSLTAVVESTVEEGCIGEIVSAVLASEQLARAVDPAVRAVLAQIAADEARHAELAWRTVAWAVRAGGSAVRAAFERAITAAIARVAATPDRMYDRDSSSTAMAAHGRLDPATIAEMTAIAITDVVGPAARALLQPVHDGTERPSARAPGLRDRI